ncbi:MAG: glycosyltransferase family 4 protein [Phycisphaerales bacterium]|nr:glycosyltransferase family 4 protein [Phycisphaerales bacterium]
MRILNVSTRMILGGSQETVVVAGEELARRGHEVHVAHGPVYGPEGSMTERIDAFRTGDGRGIARHVVPSMVREVHPVKDWRARRELRALIERVEPDVVHTHSSKAGVVGRGAAWGPSHHPRPGVVHTVHGSAFHEHERWWKNRIYVMSERWAAKRCDVMVTVSDSLRERYLEAGIGRREQYETVISGMEMGAYDDVGAGETREAIRSALGLGDEDIVIGTVARLFELKGHDDVLDALSDVLRADARMKLLWVGDGLWRGRLTERIAGMGLRDSVVMTRLVEPERIPGLIRAMDVLVHPSYREGLPRVVVQAMLCGVPVVATDIEGTGEVCEDRRTGRLVGAGDVAGLREAVMWMLDNADRARVMASAARERVRARFDARAMVDDLERVYERAVREARGG